MSSQSPPDPSRVSLVRKLEQTVSAVDRDVDHVATSASRRLVATVLPSAPPPHSARQRRGWMSALMMIIAATAAWFFWSSSSATQVTANELAKIFGDSVSAEAFRQLERPILATGEVRYVDMHEGVPVVEFRTAEGWVRAELPKDETARAARLKEGDVATVTCNFLTDNNGNGGVRLRECRLSK